MTIVIILIVIVFAAGIFLFTQASGVSSKTREEYLAEMANYLEGVLEPMEGQKESYQIKFKFDGFDVVYEDHILPGFRSPVNRAHIKIKQSGTLVLTFHERTQSQKIVSGKISMIHKVDVNEQRQSLKIPEKFKGFAIHTNNIERMNKIFSDQKFMAVLSKFKNTDSRGYLFMAVRLLDGEITLDLHNENRYYPSLLVIRKNLHLMEDPIKDAIEISKILKKYP